MAKKEFKVISKTLSELLLLKGISIKNIVELVSGVHRGLVERVKKPVDIIYYSDTEWNKRHSLIINAAKKEGKSIYA